ncbi:MAG: AAA family ATPase [Dehalococcoidia bacterium]|nr:AAA family ATPase [Dehalococcoidia bacterium]
MINSLKLLRNIGQFDSVASGADILLARLALVYAENGRGKTTLAAILRSLATGDPLPILERRRLGTQNPPHVVLDFDSGPPSAVFQNSSWNTTLPNIKIFDDVFVDQNVSSGLALGPEHRQNLHDLIIGAQGVALNQLLQQLVSKVEEHNAALRDKSRAIPASERGSLSVDDFCMLPPRADIEPAIQAAERNLAAARDRDAIHNAAFFSAFSLPSIDLVTIEQVLQTDLATLDAAAADRVQTHLTKLGSGGEAWVGDGMTRVSRVSAGMTETCPFCAQNLQGSTLIQHYRSYFSDAYSGLKRRGSEALADLNRAHGGEVPSAFERAVRVAGEQRRFWARFCDVPELLIDTETIAREWRAAREAMSAALTAKQSAPLERLTPTSQDRDAVAAYEAHRRRLDLLNQSLQQANETVRLVKEQAAGGDVPALEMDLARLKAIKARYMPDIATLCDDYMAEKAAKALTEQERDRTRVALNAYRGTVFSGYQTAINLYLQRFNAGFRLDSVAYNETRGGSTSVYNVMINNTPVKVGGTPSSGEPSFGNTLSAGDRNTLALAFFFAALDQDPALGDTVVVIDDPISSLDEHRSLTTVQEVRRLSERAGQVIVLSHKKPFLCQIWQGADSTLRSALQVARDGDGSTIRAWDVNQDSITEHDRHHAELRVYVSMGTGNSHEVARSIRPLLETFLRVARPEDFPSGTLLGPFLNRCRQRDGTPNQILAADATQELREIVEYANRFHHDTNPAWQTEVINDGELRGFARRALEFARR